MPNEREFWSEDSDDETDEDVSEFKLSFDEDEDSGDDVPELILLAPPSSPSTTSRQKLEDRFAERRLREELSDWDDWHA